MAEGDLRPKAARAPTHEEAIAERMIEVGSILGKITIDTLERLAQRMAALRCIDGLCLSLIRAIFGHILQQRGGVLAETYAWLCQNLAVTWDPLIVTTGEGIHSCADIIIDLCAQRLKQSITIPQWEHDAVRYSREVTKERVAFISTLCAHFYIYPSLHQQLLLQFQSPTSTVALGYFEAIPSLICEPSSATALGPTAEQRAEVLAWCDLRSRDLSYCDARTRFALLDLYERWAHGGKRPEPQSRKRFYKMRAVLRVIANSRALSDGQGVPRVTLNRLPVDLLAVICELLAPAAVYFMKNAKREMSKSLPKTAAP